MKRATRIARASLFTALLVAGASAPALAQSERELALEARVAELERMVQALLSQQPSQAARNEPVKTAAVPAPQPAEARPAGVTLQMPGAAAGTSIRIGGYAKADFLATRTGDGQLADGAVGRALYLPSQIPVGGASSGTDYDAHARFSRVNLGIDSVTEAGNKFGAFFEVDFFGNALGNQSATNTYGTTLRHAYLGDVGESVTGDKKAQKFEDDYLDEVIACLKDIGVPAVTYMPTRNTPEQLCVPTSKVRTSALSM